MIVGRFLICELPVSLLESFGVSLSLFEASNPTPGIESSF